VTTAIDTERLASGTEITQELRPLWLAERRRSLGASEAAALVGADPYRTPLDLFMSKIHPEEAEEQTFAQWFGTRMEPVLAEAYERETMTRIFARQVFIRQPFLPYMTATLDALREGGRPVEFKTVNARNRQIVDQLGEPGTDEVPVSWMYQCQWQAALADVGAVDLAVLVGGGDFRVYTVHRHQRLVEHLWGAAAAFMTRLVTNDPPPPTSREDCRHLAVLYRECRGEVELAAEMMHAADVYERCGAETRYHQRLRDEARLDMLAALGPADVGRLPDGRVVRRSVVEVKAHEVKAGTQVRLSIKGG
jgi:putative phage-type endonuclease